MTPAEIALALARGGRDALERDRQRINDLNVYPVPDGDTGSNLADTAAALVEGLDDPTLAAADRTALARAASRAALMGARGNSGVILSQIVRGFAEGLGPGVGTLDGATVARALRGAADAAYSAVRQPVEGTMLTAIREMAEAAEATGPEARLDEVLDAAMTAGAQAVERTPELLSVLKDAGVVDAGAAGLVEAVRGAVAGLRGQGLEPTQEAVVRPISADAIHLEPSRYTYCTSFVVEDEEIDRDQLERDLTPLGDSLLVVGEPPMVKVHVHTDDPAAALAIATDVGMIDRVEVRNMHRQTEERERRLSAEAALRLVPPPAAEAVATSVVAVAVGEGNARAFRELGADEVVEGGQSMNPSTGEIAEAIARCPGAGVVVLPNNGNVILAAEHAAAEADRPVRVVPTRSIPAGLEALGRFAQGVEIDRNAGRMRAAAEGVRTGELTTAARQAMLDGVVVTAGDHIGLVDGRLVAAGSDARTVVDGITRELLRGDPGELTVIRGDTEPFDVGAWLSQLLHERPGLEVRELDGGQPLYGLLLGASASRGAASLTAQNTAVVLDSTADLDDPQARHANWRMVPLTVRFGDEAFLDYVEMRPDEFYRRLEQAEELPQTAAPSPGAWQEMFEEVGDYSRIVVVAISSQVSATAQTAELGARAVDPGARRISVLDGLSVSIGTLLLAEGVQRLLVRGTTDNELMSWFGQARDRLGVLISVDTLEYLERGGRIGRARALLGNLLGLRPMLTLRDGAVEPFRRVRSRAQAMQEFERYLRNAVPESGTATAAVVHARDPEGAEALRAMIARVRPRVTIERVGELGAVVGTHGGPGTLAMAVLPE
jgi:hypothetical protein